MVTLLNLLTRSSQKWKEYCGFLHMPPHADFFPLVANDETVTQYRHGAYAVLGTWQDQWIYQAILEQHIKRAGAVYLERWALLGEGAH